jgi:myosin heavy subunit
MEATIGYIYFKAENTDTTVTKRRESRSAMTVPTVKDIELARVAVADCCFSSILQPIKNFKPKDCELKDIQTISLKKLKGLINIAKDKEGWKQSEYEEFLKTISIAKKDNFKISDVVGLTIDGIYNLIQVNRIGKSPMKRRNSTVKSLKEELEEKLQATEKNLQEAINEKEELQSARKESEEKSRKLNEEKQAMEDELKRIKKDLEEANKESEEKLENANKESEEKIKTLTAEKEALNAKLEEVKKDAQEKLEAAKKEAARLGAFRCISAAFFGAGLCAVANIFELALGDYTRVAGYMPVIFAPLCKTNTECALIVLGSAAVDALINRDEISSKVIFVLSLAMTAYSFMGKEEPKQNL